MKMGEGLISRNEVNTAFEMLLEKIELLANQLNEQGAEAFKAGDYDGARCAAEQATQLADFREKVKSLKKEWELLNAGQLTRPRTSRRTRPERLARDLRTPEEAFRIPILESLVELGGKASVREVLDLVGQKMKDVLTSYDQAELPSTPGTIRWRNTAQWCRLTLVREGLLKPDSPQGIWEISDAGRKYLDDWKNKSSNG
jgi:restriction system protein